MDKIKKRKTLCKYATCSSGSNVETYSTDSLINWLQVETNDFKDHVYAGYIVRNICLDGSPCYGGTNDAKFELTISDLDRFKTRHVPVEIEHDSKKEIGNVICSFHDHIDAQHINYGILFRLENNLDETYDELSLCTLNTDERRSKVVIEVSVCKKGRRNGCVFKKIDSYQKCCGIFEPVSNNTSLNSNTAHPIVVMASADVDAIDDELQTSKSPDADIDNSTAPLPGSDTLESRHQLRVSPPAEITPSQPPPPPPTPPETMQEEQIKKQSHSISHIDEIRKMHSELMERSSLQEQFTQQQQMMMQLQQQVLQQNASQPPPTEQLQPPPPQQKQLPTSPNKLDTATSEYRNFILDRFAQDQTRDHATYIMNDTKMSLSERLNKLSELQKQHNNATKTETKITKKKDSLDSILNRDIASNETKDMQQHQQEKVPTTKVLVEEPPYKRQKVVTNEPLPAQQQQQQQRQIDESKKLYFSPTVEDLFSLENDKDKVNTMKNALKSMINTKLYKDNPHDASNYEQMESSTQYLLNNEDENLIQENQNSGLVINSGLWSKYPKTRLVQASASNTSSKGKTTPLVKLDEKTVRREEIACHKTTNMSLPKTICGIPYVY